MATPGRSRRDWLLAQVQLSSDVLAGGDVPPGMQGVDQVPVEGQARAWVLQHGVQKWLAAQALQARGALRTYPALQAQVDCAMRPKVVSSGAHGTHASGGISTLRNVLAGHGLQTPVDVLM